MWWYYNTSLEIELLQLWLWLGNWGEVRSHIVYEYCSSHDKDLCRGLKALILANSIVVVLQVCCITHSWLPQGTVLVPSLVNSFNSDDKCNHQNNNKSFIAVIHVLATCSIFYCCVSLLHCEENPSTATFRDFPKPACSLYTSSKGSQHGALSKKSLDW